MLLQDLRYAVRSATRRPGFSLLVVGTLALGIGANSAMFTVVNSVLLRPLPFPRSEELVSVFAGANRTPQGPLSPPDFVDYRARNTVFASLAARTRFGTATLSGDGDPERVSGAFVTTNYFTTLGIAPFIGRAFLPEEEAGEGATVAVLSYGLWQRRFAGDRTIIGRAITVDGRPVTVVGVMPPVLDRTLDVQLWRPVGFGSQGMQVRRFHFLGVIGRLKPGVSLSTANAQLDGIARQLEAAYPEDKDWRVAARDYQEDLVGSSRTGLLILLGAVGLVLLIACGNVASLMLARATARQSEIAIRTALGAARGRLVRQLLTESLLLGAAAGLVGLALALALLRGTRVLSAAILPRVAEVQLDGTALAFTLVLSLATGIIFGLAPALHAVRGGLAAAMGAGARSSTSRGGARLRDTLVVAQVALSVTLLMGAGLLLRSLWQLEHVTLGFDPARVLSAEIVLPQSESRTPDATLAFWDRFMERLRATPGVVAAAGTTLLPMDGGGDTYYYVEGQTPATPSDRRNATLSTVTESYFATMRIPVIAGREIQHADGGDAPPVVVINEGMARRLFRGERALGHRLVVDLGRPVVAEIVGVVGDVRIYGPTNEAPDVMYLSRRLRGAWGQGYFRPVVRTAGNPEALIGAMRTALRELDPTVPLAKPRPMEWVVGDAVALERLRARVLAGFAGTALLLALIGLYGVLSYAVAQRRREMGIRIALGAREHAVFGLVLRRGMTLVIAGLLIGVVASLGATRLVASLLFDVGRTDPAVFGTATAALFLAGLSACVLPAWRAMRVDPAVALRQE